MKVVCLSISRANVADDGAIGKHQNTCPVMHADFPSMVFHTACSSVVDHVHQVVVPSCQLCPERCDSKDNNNNMCMKDAREMCATYVIG